MLRTVEKGTRSYPNQRRGIKIRNRDVTVLRPGGFKTLSLIHNPTGIEVSVGSRLHIRKDLADSFHILLSRAKNKIKKAIRRRKDYKGKLGSMKAVTV